MNVDEFERMTTNYFIGGVCAGLALCAAMMVIMIILQRMLLA